MNEVVTLQSFNITADGMEYTYTFDVALSALKAYLDTDDYSKVTRFIMSECTGDDTERIIEYCDIHGEFFEEVSVEKTGVFLFNSISAY
jgi:hypothetical protein